MAAVAVDASPHRRPLRGSKEMPGGGPSRLFILRPVATTLLMIGLLLVGIVAYRQLPVSALPQVDYPTIQVTTFYPGAGPEVPSVAGDRRQQASAVSPAAMPSALPRKSQPSSV